jgi:hypothetical protein
MCVVTPEIWTIKNLCDLTHAQRVVPMGHIDTPDPDEVLSFCEAIRAGAPLGSIILAETGPSLDCYSVIDGRFRVETIARVFCPEQFAADEGWPVYLQAFDRGGALAWGDTADDPAALPLHVLASTMGFLGWATWAADMSRGEPDHDRSVQVLEDAHRASHMLDAKILVYRVRGAESDTLARMRGQANSRFGHR